MLSGQVPTSFLIIKITWRPWIFIVLQAQQMTYICRKRLSVRQIVIFNACHLISSLNQILYERYLLLGSADEDGS